MLKVLLAQSCHQFCIKCCIHHGLEMNFVFDTEQCYQELKTNVYDALVLSTDLNESEEVSIHLVMKLATDQRIAVFCLSDEMNSDTIRFLFDYQISTFFIGPVSYQDVVNKLSELQGNREEKIIEKKASELLLELGVPTSIQGYSYLVDSVVMCYYNQTCLKGITKNLYPRLANEYKTTSAAVEKSIRHAIETAFTYSNLEDMYDLFKGSIRSDKAKATNAQFISMCVKYIQSESYKSET